MIVLNIIWSENIRTRDPGKNNFAGAGFCESERIELVTLQAVTLIIILMAAGARVETRQSIIGTQPEITLIIFHNAIDDIIGQAVFHSIVSGIAALWVELVQPFIGAKPHRASMVLHDDKDLVAAERLWVIWIVAIMGKRPCF